MPRQTISKLSAGDLSTLSKGTGVLVSYNIAINNSFIIHVLFGAEMLDGPINFMIISYDFLCSVGLFISLIIYSIIK